MDKLTKEKRSWNMSKIKNRNTKPEVMVRKFLFDRGYRYRIKNDLFGKPDLVINGKKLAVFIDGCFWHQHNNCKLSYMPKTNTDFWNQKLLRNKKRDKAVNEKLSSDGWRIMRLWECDIERDIRSCFVNVTI